jgi:hypothetical protein
MRTIMTIQIIFGNPNSAFRTKQRVIVVNELTSNRQFTYPRFDAIAMCCIIMEIRVEVSESARRSP